MNLTLLLEGAVIVVAIVLMGTAYYKYRENGGKSIPWDKLRPIIADAYMEVNKIKDAEKIGYQALEDYAVLYVRNQILKADFISETEKALISDELIRSMIAPQLMKIYKAQKA